jgi:hypothetical protein
LSGAAAEFLSIWNVMMAGHRPFYMKEGKLYLELKPILPEWMFDDENKVSFNFLGKTKVTYINPNRKSTYDGTEVTETTVVYKDGSKFDIPGGCLTESFAEDVRTGKIANIVINIV